MYSKPQPSARSIRPPGWRRCRRRATPLEWHGDEGVGWRESTRDATKFVHCICQLGDEPAVAQTVCAARRGVARVGKGAEEREELFARRRVWCAARLWQRGESSERPRAKAVVHAPAFEVKQRRQKVGDTRDGDLGTGSGTRLWRHVAQWEGAAELQGPKKEETTWASSTSSGIFSEATEDAYKGCGHSRCA